MPSTWIEPRFLSAFRQTGLVMVQSTRHGGVSPAPWASLNLGLHTDDAPERVRENRRRFFEALGIDPATVAGGHQVHGAEVCVVERAGQYDGYDAFVTDRPGLLLSVTVADCVPVLFYDQRTGAAGAAHAGWRGTVAGVAVATLKAMEHHFGTRPADLWVWIGVAIGFDHFEVGEEVARHFAARQGEHLLKKPAAQPGKWYVDLKAANRVQLEAAGVPPRQIEVAPWCTVAHNADFFSHRKEAGHTGRMLAVVGRRTFSREKNRS